MHVCMELCTQQSDQSTYITEVQLLGSTSSQLLILHFEKSVCTSWEAQVINATDYSQMLPHPPYLIPPTHHWNAIIITYFIKILYSDQLVGLKSSYYFVDTDERGSIPGLSVSPTL